MTNQLDYLTAKRESKAITRLYEQVLTCLKRAEDAHDNGQEVVWCGGTLETPLVLSYGIFPCTYGNLAILGTADAMSTAEKIFQIPRETCSMAKVLLGELALRKGGPRRLIGYCSSCEPINAILENLREENFDVHFIDTPLKSANLSDERYEGLVDYVIKELRTAGEWLGGEVNEKRLSEEIKRANRARKKVHEILDLRLNAPHYMGSLDTMFLLSGVGHYYGDPDTYIDICDDLIQELKQAQHKTSTNGSSIPLLWAGGRGNEYGTYNLIDGMGGDVLGWATPFPKILDESLPPLEALARDYLESQFFGSANKYFLKYVESELERSKAKGIIFYGYIACSFMLVDFEIMKKHFSKKGIPSIILEGSFQVGEPSGQTITRVKAFMEMLAKPKIIECTA